MLERGICVAEKLFKSIILAAAILTTRHAIAQVQGEELVPYRPDANGIVIMPDGRKCRGIVDVNAQGKEVTRILECEKPRGEGGLPKASKPKGTGFDLNDAEAHFAAKFYYSLDPKGAFTDVTVGSTKGAADMNYNSALGFEFEYGFYNKYAWNLTAGVGIDLPRTANNIKYNFNYNPTEKATFGFSALNLSLNLYRGFENFYLMGGIRYFIPQAQFQNVQSASMSGGLGFGVEFGYHFMRRWGTYLAYRDVPISAEAITKNFSNNENYRSGKYSDILLGLRYYFR